MMKKAVLRLQLIQVLFYYASYACGSAALLDLSQPSEVKFKKESAHPEFDSAYPLLGYNLPDSPYTVFSFSDIAGSYNFKTSLFKMPVNQRAILDSNKTWFASFPMDKFFRPYLKAKDQTDNAAIGSSMGGFGALYFGAMNSRHVARVVAFGPQTYFGDEVDFGYRPQNDLSARDLRPLIEAAVKTTFYVFAREDSPSDIFHAMHICDLDNVVCKFMKRTRKDHSCFSCDHNVAGEIKKRIKGENFINFLYQLMFIGESLESTLLMTPGLDDLFRDPESYDRDLYFALMKDRNAQLESTPKHLRSYYLQWIKAHSDLSAGRSLDYIHKMAGIIKEGYHLRKVWQDMLDIVFGVYVKTPEEEMLNKDEARQVIQELNSLLPSNEDEDEKANPCLPESLQKIYSQISYAVAQLKLKI